MQASSAYRWLFSTNQFQLDVHCNACNSPWATQPASLGRLEHKVPMSRRFKPRNVDIYSPPDMAMARPRGDPGYCGGIPLTVELISKKKVKIK